MEWILLLKLALMIDFRFLEEVFADKRIIWLGENGHGVAEHSLLKAKIIDFLYHKMGFKVLAFESGLGESYSANYIKEYLTTEELMEKSIFSLWKTEETYPLFELIQENEDLNLIGFDFQPSVKQSLFVDFIQKLPIDFPKNFFQKMKELEETKIYWYEKIGQYKAMRKKIPKELFIEFKQVYRELEAQIDQLQMMLKEKEEEFLGVQLEKEYALIQKGLENKQFFIQHLTTKPKEYIKLRDQKMSENLEWICHELYPNEKIIVWAHNNHIYKNLKGNYKLMGSLMGPELNKQSYHLGFYMYEGEVTFDKKNYQKVRKPLKKSLEDYMNHHPSPVSFLDFSKTKPNQANQWIFRNTIIIDSGTMLMSIVPNKQLDGAFFVRKVSPPKYL